MLEMGSRFGLWRLVGWAFACSLDVNSIACSRALGIVSYALLAQILELDPANGEENTEILRLRSQASTIASVFKFEATCS